MSLIELLTGVAVLGVSLTMVAPAWRDFTDRNRIVTAANSVLTNLHLARSTAVSRNRRVGLCPSTDGIGCSGDAFGWQDGYIVFVDLDGDRSRDEDEPLLRRQDAQPHGLLLHTSAGRPVLSFRPDGSAWGTNASFRVCLGDTRSAYRAVVLYGSGRARIDRRLPDGRKVACD